MQPKEHARLVVDFAMPIYALHLAAGRYAVAEDLLIKMRRACVVVLGVDDEEFNAIVDDSHLALTGDYPPVVIGLEPLEQGN